MEADDDYAVALMRRHGVTPGTIATLGEVSRAYRRFAGEAVPSAASSSRRRRARGGRAPLAGRRAPRPLARPTRCSPRDGLLLAGDHLLEKISSNPIAHVPVGAPDPVALAASPDRPRTLLTYLASLEATAAADRGELILPGHGDPFTGAAALVREARRDERAARARRSSRALDGARTAAEVGRDLWRHVPVTQAYLVLSEVLGHLDLLEARGRVAQEAGEDGVVRWTRT